MTSKSNGERKELITLNPSDYLVLQGGLKIENVTDSLAITFEIPNRLTISIIEITNENFVTNQTRK